MADVKLRVETEDAASQTLDSIGDKLQGLGEIFISVEGIRKLIDTITEAETATIRLDTVLRNVGNIGVTRGEMDKFSESLLKNSVYTRQAGQAMQAMLATFQNLNGDQFRKAEQAILDFASFRGVDLTTAAQMIGRVLNEPAQALGLLTRMGVQFSQAQRDVIKDLVDVGNYAAAQDIILKRLTDTYHGTAETVSNTLGGALQQLRNNFVSLFEGENAPTDKLIESIHNLTHTLSDPEVVKGVSDLVTQLVRLADVLVRIASIKLPTNAISEWLNNFRYDALSKAANVLDTLDNQLGKLNITYAGVHLGHQGASPGGQLIRGARDFVDTDQIAAGVLPPDMREAVGGPDSGGPLRTGSSNDWLIAGQRKLQEDYIKSINELGKKSRDEMQKLSDTDATKAFDTLHKALEQGQEDWQKFSDSIIKASESPIESVNREFQDLAINIGLVRDKLVEERNANEQAGLSTANLDAKIATLSQKLELLPEQHAKALKAAQDSFTTMGVYAAQARDQIAGAFESAFTHINEGFKGMLKSFLQVLEQMVLRAEATDLATLLSLKTAPGVGGGTATGGILSALAGLFGLGGGASSTGGASIDTSEAWADAIAYERFASGGFAMGSAPVIVGERGPELLMPGYQGATVFPNGAQQTPGQPMTYAPTTNINGTGLDAGTLSAVIAANNDRQRYEFMRMLYRNGVARLHSG